MKRTPLFALIFVLLLGACNNEKGSTSEEKKPSSSSGTDKHFAVYKKALKDGDVTTAIVALNYVLLEDSTNMEYTDTLARLYMQSSQFRTGVLLGDKVLKQQPENYELLEMVAKSKFQTGDFDGAAADFETLYANNDKVEYLYQLAAIDFYSEDYDGCVQKSEDLLKSPRIDSSVVDFMTQAGGVQRVPLRAATHYVRGMVHIARGNASSAGVELRKALKIKPEFEEAQYRYQMVMEYQKNMAEQSEYLKAQKKLQERFGK